MRKNPLFAASLIWAFVLSAVGQNQPVQNSTQPVTGVAPASGLFLQDGTPVKLRSSAISRLKTFPDRSVIGALVVGVARSSRF
jgi:hypothetical protein